MNFKHLLWAVALLCSFARADNLGSFVESFSEQGKAVSWVQTKTKGALDEAETQSIVRGVYAHAISKNLNPRLVLAMIKQESNFQAKAKSKAKAAGLMQVIPKYHKDKLQGRDPYDRQVSIEVGTAILQDYLDKFKGNTAKALYGYSGGSKTYYTKVLKLQYDLANSMKPASEVLASNP